eukprot:8423068-Pyramimonas_sp.AAC.1
MESRAARATSAPSTTPSSSSLLAPPHCWLASSSQCRGRQAHSAPLASDGRPWQPVGLVGASETQSRGGP